MGGITSTAIKNRRDAAQTPDAAVFAYDVQSPVLAIYGHCSNAMVGTRGMSGQMMEAQGPRAYREQGTGTESESAHADIVIDLSVVRQRYSALQHLLQAASIYYAVKVFRPRNFLGKS
jgi:hypothetical protein